MLDLVHHPVSEITVRSDRDLRLVAVLTHVTPTGDKMRQNKQFEIIFLFLKKLEETVPSFLSVGVYLNL